jgi:hypothetical protein
MNNINRETDACYWFVVLIMLLMEKLMFLFYTNNVYAWGVRTLTGSAQLLKTLKKCIEAFVHGNIGQLKISQE